MLGEDFDLNMERYLNEIVMVNWHQKRRWDLTNEEIIALEDEKAFTDAINQAQVNWVMTVHDILNIDNYLDFRNNEVLDFSKEEWFTKTDFQKKLDELNFDKYCWCMYYSINWINTLTPIYKAWEEGIRYQISSEWVENLDSIEDVERLVLNMYNEIKVFIFKNEETWSYSVYTEKLKSSLSSICETVSEGHNNEM